MYWTAASGAGYSRCDREDLGGRGPRSTDPPMKKRLLLVTPPLSRSQELRLLAALGKGMAGVPLQAVSETPATRTRAGAPGSRPRPLLSPRQLEVLREIARGTSTKGIAKALDLSAKTVETYRLQLMQRLGIRRVPELVRYALRTGLLGPDWLLEKGERNPGGRPPKAR